jgi:hypothetical protein
MEGHKAALRRQGPIRFEAVMARWFVRMGVFLQCATVKLGPHHEYAQVISGVILRT